MRTVNKGENNSWEATLIAKFCKKTKFWSSDTKADSGSNMSPRQFKQTHQFSQIASWKTELQATSRKHACSSVLQTGKPWTQHVTQGVSRKITRLVKTVAKYAENYQPVNSQLLTFNDQVRVHQLQNAVALSLDEMTEGALKPVTAVEQTAEIFSIIPDAPINKFI